MGVFSTNRSHLGYVGTENIVANENYVGGVGALQMTLEGYQNDQALFEAVLGMDFQEAYALHEGVELEVFTEASASQFIEKIKGLFQTFITKFNGVVMRDNKAFVDKYKKAVSIKDLSKMKYKWAEPKGIENVTMSSVEAAVVGRLNEIKDCKTDSDLEKINEELNDPDELDKILSELLGKGNTTDKKSFNKDFRDLMFEDEEEEEGLKNDRLMKIISVLSEKKTISDMEKTKKEFDKYFSKLLNEISKLSNTIGKDALDKDKAGNYEIKNASSSKNNVKDKYNKGEASKAVAKFNAMQKSISLYQTGINMFVGRYIEENKNYIKQCRRVFAQAASFNPKAVKENALLVEAFGEAAEFELHTLIESAEM